MEDSHRAALLASNSRAVQAMRFEDEVATAQDRNHRVDDAHVGDGDEQQAGNYRCQCLKNALQPHGHATSNDAEHRHPGVRVVIAVLH